MIYVFQPKKRLTLGIDLPKQHKFYTVIGCKIIPLSISDHDSKPLSARKLAFGNIMV